MAFNLNNFVIDRVLRAVGMSKDDSILFAINQVTNPSLNVTSETAEAVDALGTPIAIFNRAKTCEFSAENAIFDMDLMAVQAGSSKQVAASDAVIAVPMFEILEGSALSKTPVDGAVKFYALNGDGSLGEALAISADGTTDGGIVVDGLNISGLPEGVQVMAVYEYNANGEEKNGAVSVINSATEFPKACKLVLEILGCDVCNQEELIYAYLILPNFKISPDFDWNLATDGTHPFSGTAMQDYCDSKKVLYQLIIAE